MLIFRLLQIAIVLLGNVFYTCYAAEVGSDSDDPHDADVVTSDLLSWLRSNGAYINEKLVVKHTVPDDPTSPRGVFSTQDMDVGEKLCSIPSDLIIQPREELMEGVPPEHTYCSTIKAVTKAMVVDDSTTPYGRYLLAQPKGYLPRFWSDSGKDLLMNMLKSSRKEQLTAYDELPPHGVDDIYDLEVDCNCDLNDPLYVQAAMLVMARADYDFMIPFYDMFNHHNGKYNIRHEYDAYKENKHNPFVDAQHGFITTKAIKAGDELYNSYNQCNICYDYHDHMGTPEIFLHFGFVEPMPQRWLFDFARVKFDLNWKDGDETSEEVVVNFLVPLSEKGKHLLQEELTRLKSFAAMHRNTSYEEYENMSKYEWESLWQYYNALHDAISYAVEQSNNVEMTNGVWKLDDDWWVQDGTLKAADVEDHYVLSTQRMVSKDELRNVLNLEL